MYSVERLCDPKSRTDFRIGSDWCLFDSTMVTYLQSHQPAHQLPPLPRPEALLRVVRVLHKRRQGRFDFPVHSVFGAGL